MLALQDVIRETSIVSAPPLIRAVEYIMENFAEDIKLDDLAEAAGISKFELCRKFQKRYGTSPIRWLWMFRSMIAAEFIKAAPAWSLTDVAFNSGFSSSAHFSRTFYAAHGISPSGFRFRYHGELVRVPRRCGFAEFTKLYYDNANAVIAAFKATMGRSAVLAH